jgi:sugar/nucleoside kinase (ribokinase family)
MARRPDVAVMHDYFVDRLVHAKRTASLLSKVGAKEREGGGSVHGVSQEDVRGGNAVNLAHALSVLEVPTLLITHSDSHHLPLLMETFEGLGAEVRVKALPAGLTVAFEGRTNVMISNVGGSGRFPPSLLDAGDWASLRRCRLVCSVNWAANRHGTELLASLRAGLPKRTRIFLNPADFRDRRAEYKRLVLALKKKRLIDWLSVNQYEAEATAAALGHGRLGPGETCSAVAGDLGIMVDVHTENGSFTSSGGEVEFAPNRRVAPRRLTGAGDVWDAASIYAWLREWGSERRLRFANAAGRLYVSSRTVVPPSLGDISSSLL